MLDSIFLILSTYLTDIKNMQKSSYNKKIYLHPNFVSSHRSLLFRYSASVVMALAYGKDPKSYEDPDILAVNRCLARLGNTLRPGVWKVDVFPFLRLGIIYLSSSERYPSIYLRQIHSRLFDRIARWSCGRTDVIQTTIARYPIEYGMFFLSYLFIIKKKNNLISDGKFQRKKAKKLLSHLGNTFLSVSKTSSFPIMRQLIWLEACLVLVPIQRRRL